MAYVEILAVAEHLLRSHKRRILAPLNRRLARAIAARFRSQSRAIRRTLAPLLRVALREADRPVPPGLLAAVAAAMAQRRPIVGYSRVTRGAYDGGADISAGELDVALPDAIPGPGRISEEVEADLDRTTIDRLGVALADAMDGLTPFEALRELAAVFQARVEAAPAIAEHEVSRAFHEGQVDTARAIATDEGVDVEKRWDAEPDACDDCLDCEDEEWVDIDFEYAVFGVEDPPGHVNCRCALSMRRVKAEG